MFDIHFQISKKINKEILAKQYKPTEEDITNEYFPYEIENIQSYIPIMSLFNENISSDDSFVIENSIIDLNTIVSKNGEVQNKNIFVKFSPLLDPIQYMIGKYKNVEKQLPNLSNNTMIFPKLKDTNNSSYVDGFFCFLSSQLLKHCNFIHGIDFYGSFLGIQKKCKINITDDIDYLQGSSFFNSNLNKLFSISHEFSFLSDQSFKNKKKIKINDEDCEIDFVTIEEEENNKNEIEEEIIEECNEIIYEKQSNHSTSEKSFNSSNTSNNSELNYTSDEEESDNNDDDVDDENESICSKNDTNTDDESVSSTDNTDDSESEDTCESDEEDIFSYIHSFPVQMICMEKCEGTLDELISKKKLTVEESISALMQIIMSLIVYQKTFNFTHNDLHTNNIMWIKTEQKFIYYRFNNETYKIKTYGKIYKIIDFGRSIYTYKNHLFCSDSYSNDGDANTQYNFEPYYNPKKPLLFPNPSFDLCRLGCSIYDFIIEEDDEYDNMNEFQKIIYKWCLDDNNKNILHKKNGEERYPNFKLYKMIARTVHHCIPQEQLKLPVFQQFKTNEEIQTNCFINIDEMKSCF